MATRQESASETRKKYNKSPRPVPGVPKFRSGANWSKMPDYSRLPDYALLGMSEVAVITGMSHSVIERRVRDGDFAAPKYHGKSRIWSLGYVRQWCEQFGQSLNEGGDV
jgi:predicted DNA-binding transcriptional regulator AlpA